MKKLITRRLSHNHVQIKPRAHTAARTNLFLRTFEKPFDNVFGGFFDQARWPDKSDLCVQSTRNKKRMSFLIARGIKLHLNRWFQAIE